MPGLAARAGQIFNLTLTARRGRAARKYGFPSALFGRQSRNVAYPFITGTSTNEMGAILRIRAEAGDTKDFIFYGVASRFALRVIRGALAIRSVVTEWASCPIRSFHS